MPKGNVSAQHKQTSTRGRWQGWSWRKRGLVMLGGVVLAIATLTPMGREWVLFALLGGKWFTPKGWPMQERGWDKPTDPRELAAYEYAHALKLPDSLPKPVPFNFNKHLLSNRGTTARAYFDHLCATEAGEYIFKTVDKVEGIYQMRGMPKYDDKMMTERYAFEDPADWSQGEGDGSQSLFLGKPNLGFRYFESVRSPEEITGKIWRERWRIVPWDQSGKAPYWRYQHFDYTNGSGEVEPTEQLESRYAYTWRGLRREHDRAYGIAGGELIVLDRITNEILGVRRSFSIAYESSKRNHGQLNWEFAYYCPKNMIYRSIGRRPEINKVLYPYDFISQVLMPIDFDPSKIRFN
ncbi:MAG: hypothetical protein LBU53_04145 [Zoogloeaceae bacterium]|jgi:hypothetical protein|nr:hypothetical protein [Zoogloeaceae bacterium]